MHIFAGTEIAQDALRPEPEPSEAETGVRGALRGGQRAAVGEDSGRRGGGGECTLCNRAHSRT